MNNLNLCWLLGLEQNIKCPYCKGPAISDFEDFNIDSKHYWKREGDYFESVCFCLPCDAQWTVRYKIIAERLPDEGV
jgi:hypothetical protein